MRSLLVCSITLTMLLVLSPAALARGGGGGLDDWMQAHGTASHNNLRPVQDRIGCPAIQWFLKDAHSVPAVFKGKVYAGGKDLHCIDLKTGKVLRKVPAGGPEEREGPNAVYYTGTPAIGKKAVHVVKSRGMVEAWSFDLGKKLWSCDVSEKGSGPWGFFPLSLEDGILVLAGGAVLGISEEDGKLLWAWQEGKVEMAPAVWKGKVYFGTNRGELVCVHHKTGKTQWKKDCQRRFGWSNPVVVNGILYLADRGAGQRRGAFNAFGTSQGGELWSKEFGATGASTPCVGPKSIFLGFGKFVGEFDFKTGKPGPSSGYRTYFNPFGTPTIIGKTLAFGNLDGNLYVFDCKTERLKWRFQPKPPEGHKEVQVLGFAYLKKGVFLVSTTKGIFCIGQSRKKRKCSAGFVLLEK